MLRHHWDFSGTSLGLWPWTGFRRSSGLREDRVDGGAASCLRAEQEVRVLPKREPGVGVAEPSGQGHDRLAGLQSLGGVEVAQGMVAGLSGRLPYSRRVTRRL